MSNNGAIFTYNGLYICVTGDHFPALQLGSYPILHNPDYNVLLTLEAKQADDVEDALWFLLDRLPSAMVVRVE